MKQIWPEEPKEFIVGDGQQYHFHLSGLKPEEAQAEKVWLKKIGFDVKVVKRDDRFSVYRRLQAKPVDEAMEVRVFMTERIKSVMLASGLDPYTGAFIDDDPEE